MRHHDRLRQVDVKAEHFERQVQRLEQERDQWEKKYEVRSECCVLWLWFCISQFYEGCAREIPAIKERARRARTFDGGPLIFPHLIMVCR